MSEQKRDKDEGILPLLLIGGAVAVAAVIGTGGGEEEDEIHLFGSASCSLISPTNAQVHLQWTSTTIDTEFDVLRNGSTLDSSVTHDWLSNLMAAGQQGQTYQFQVIGVQSGKVSNVIPLTIPICTGVGSPQVSGIGMNWS